MQPTNEETRNFEEPKKSNTKMKLTFTSPTADSADFTLEERKAAFMNNEELMREATKYVTEIVEKAKIEAAKREQVKGFFFLLLLFLLFNFFFFSSTLLLEFSN